VPPSSNRGSLIAAANNRAWNVHRRRKARVNAPETASGLDADPNLHPRKVAQIVVRVGPPIRITIFRVVVAIGRSSRFTDT
jgi:hypothetical protein